MKNSATVLFLLCGLLAPLGAQTAPRKFELQANSPQFWQLLDRQAKLAKVAGGFGFTEGPVWDPAGFLFVSDETLNKIFRVISTAAKRHSSCWATPTATPSTASSGCWTAPVC